MDRVIIVYYEGKTQWWAAIKRTNEQIRFDHFLRFFLEKLEQNTNEKVTLKQIILYDLSDFQKKKIDDLTRFIPNSDSDLEYLVTIDDKAPFRKKGISLQPKIQKFIDSGKEFCEKKDYKNGLDLFTAADIYGLLDSAKVLYKLKRWKLIKSFYPKLLVIFPGSIDASVIYGAYLEHTGKIDEALDAYKRALKFTDSPEITVGLSRIFMQKGDLKYVEFMLKSALIVDDFNPNALIQSSIYSMKMGDYEKAVLTCMRNPKCYKFLAEICKTAEGFEAMQRTLFNLKISEKGHAEIAWSLYLLGRRDEALHLMNQVCLETNFGHIIATTYLYSLLVDGRTNTFFEILQLFFEKHGLESYMNLVLRETSALFSSLGSYTPKRFHTSTFSESTNRFVPKIIVAFYAILVIFLYVNGNFYECGILKNHVKPYIDSLVQVTECNIIRRMFTLCQASQKIYIGTPAGYICAIGDEFLLSLGSSPIIADDMPLYFKHLPIPTLSIWKLIKKNGNGLIERFYDAVEYSTKYSALLLYLGTNDCEMEIPRLIRKCRISSVKEAVHIFVTGYVNIIKAIKTNNPELPIYIHPAIPRYMVTSPIVGSFNTELKNQLGDMCWFLGNCVSEGLYPSSFALSGSHYERYKDNLRHEISKHIIKDQ